MPWRDGGPAGGSLQSDPAHQPHVHTGFFGGLKHFFGNAWTEAKQLVGSLPQMPSEVAHDATRAAAFFSGGRSSPLYSLSQKRVPGEPAGGTTGIASFGELMHDIHKKGVWEPVLSLPLIRFIPGTYLASGVSKGPINELKQLYEHPVQSALDVLPFAHEATQALTKGGSLAEEAATHAAETGHAGRAAKIAKQGLTPLQASAAVARRVEGRLPKRWGPAPVSRQLAHLGLGGETLRQTMREIGAGNSHYASHLNEKLTSLAGKDKELGITTSRAEELTHELSRSTEPREAILARLPENEREWAKFIEDENMQLTSHGPYEMRDGEVWTKQEARQLDRMAKIAAERTNKIQMMQPDPAIFGGRSRVIPGKELERLLNRAEAARASISRMVPARWKPIINDLVHGDEIALLKARSGGVLEPHAEDLIKAGDFEGAGISRAEHYKMVRERAPQWRELKARGVDPLYTHHVGVDEVGKIAHPKLITRVVTPSSWKRLAWDMKPWIENASVAVSHRWAEQIQFEEAERLAGEMRKSGLVKMRPEFEAEVRQWADAGAGRGKTYADRINSLRKQYHVYDPRTLFPREGGLGAGGKGDFYMHKDIAKAFESARPRDAAMGFSKVLHGTNRLFRLSYLYFRPFYYAHVTISGAVLSLARGGPRDLLMLPKALELMRTGELPAELSLGYGRYASAEEGSFKMGSTLGDELIRRYGHMSKPEDIIRRVEHVTHKMASTVQDMWKSSSYLAELKRAGRGYTQEEAISLAVEHANKVFGNMNELVPFERFAVRSVLPFYAWSKHLLQYVSSYPFDHPWRAALVANIGAAVIEDWKVQHEGLPDRFMHYFWLKNKGGNETFFPASGLMPFTQVGDMLTWSGFLSRLDPRLRAVLETSGVDTYTGGATADYRQAHGYNPEKGIEVPKAQNLASTMIKDLMPWADPFFQSSDYQQYLANNPSKRREYLMRLILGASPTTRNIQNEIDKAKKAQQFTAADEAKRLKSQQPKTASGGGWKN